MQNAPLSGQTHVVVGPAKGMGRAVTLALAEAGADLVLAGRDLEAIEPVAAEVQALGRRALVCACNITDDDSVATMTSQACAAFEDRIDGLVNVAGATGPSGKKIWEHTRQDYHDVFDVNVLGTVLTLRHLLPVMIARGRGAVVNIGGTFGFKGVRDASLYGATKWALRGVTKSAALEAGPYGVRVNMVSPGGVEGPRLDRQMGQQAEREGAPVAELRDRFIAGTALGQLSKDTDIAAAILFLLSDAARNITGQDLLVDGGTIV